MPKQKRSKEPALEKSEEGYWSHFFQLWAGSTWSGDFFKEAAADKETLKQKEK